MSSNDKPKNKLDHARDLQIWIWSDKPVIKDTADFIFKKMERDDKIGKLNKNRIKNTLKVILTDLYVTHKHDNKMYIIISKNRNDYRKHKYFRSVYIQYKHLIPVFNYLIDKGYIKQKRGINYERCKRRTRIKWTDKLLRLFREYDKGDGKIILRRPPVILKNKAKDQIDFDMDTIETRTIIRNASKINAYLNQHAFTLPFDSVEIDGRITSTEEAYIRFSQYSRIFNNSSFEQGGRFFDHWSQMIKSGQRRFIKIDGKDTVELDYSCLHITMLYGLEGLVLPQGDQYELKDIPFCYRGIIKKAVNIAINAENEKDAIGALRKEMREFCKEKKLPYFHPKTLLDAILMKHEVIKQYFYTGYGVRLQFLESKIAEKIMLTLGAQNIGCLCIHDSFIVSKDSEEILQNLMITYFDEIFHLYPTVTSKYDLFNQKSSITRA